MKTSRYPDDLTGDAESRAAPTPARHPDTVVLLCIGLLAGFLAGVIAGVLIATLAP